MVHDPQVVDQAADWLVQAQRSRTPCEPVRDLLGEDDIAAALEIVDSRIRGWDIRITDTVADNASSGLFVLGSRRVAMSRFESADVAMSMTVDDAQRSAGFGADCMGDQLIAVQWPASTCALVGSPLRAGEIVLSGAVDPMVAVNPGVLVHADLSELGPVSASFACAR